jgi:hypothetical protein
MPGRRTSRRRRTVGARERIGREAARVEARVVRAGVVSAGVVSAGVVEAGVVNHTLLKARVGAADEIALEDVEHEIVLQNRHRRLRVEDRIAGEMGGQS